MTIYRDIIKEEIRKLTSKKEKTKDKEELNRIEYFIGQLVEDLRNYETKGQIPWRREPYDAAYRKYTMPSPIFDLDRFLKEFFGW